MKKTLLVTSLLLAFVNFGVNAEIKKFNMVFVPASEKGDENDYTSLIKIVNKLTGLSDVNASTLNDGAMIQYDDTSKKFVTRTEIKTESGNLILNGGTF